MSSLSSNYILVSKALEPVSEGFQAVAVEDSSVYKGKVEQLPDNPVYLSNQALKVGDIVIFAKYSPDTHLIERDGVELKYINTRDLLEVL